LTAVALNSLNGVRSTEERGAIQEGSEPGVTARSEGDTAWDRLRSARGFIFDMDGVLYRGDAALPGVVPLLDALALRGRRYILATNNSTATPAMYVAKLREMGIDVPPEAILTSALATRDYLRETLPRGSGIYTIGMPAMREQLFGDGDFEPVQFGETQPAAVVVALDTGFTYDKLKAANAAIRGGARFIATNADATLPTEAGLVPGSGSIVAAVATASGVDPVVIGKPETPLLEQALELMGVAVSEAAMIGDRLDTDILAARRAGILSVLVLTGVSTRDELVDSPVLPDIVVNDLPSLLAALIGDGPVG
jgi:HAD superfamily hydrolase (TIGR01457 family)